MRWSLVLVVSCFALAAQADEVTWVEEKRYPISGVETHEVVITRITIPPGATLPRHMHQADEYGFITNTYEATGPSGESVNQAVGYTELVAAGVEHGGMTNVGETDIVARSVSIVPKGAALTVTIGDKTFGVAPE